MEQILGPIFSPQPAAWLHFQLRAQWAVCSPVRVREGGPQMPRSDFR